MKFQFDRQAYLKGLLLLVLATNASWDLHSNPFVAANRRVKSTELASTGAQPEVVQTTAGAAAGRSLTTPTTQTGAEVARVASNSGVGPAPAASVAAKVVADPNQPGISVVNIAKTNSEFRIIDVCSAHYDVTTVEQISPKDQSKSIVTTVRRMAANATAHSDQNQPILTKPFLHSYDDVFVDPVKAVAYMDQVKSDIKALDCPEKPVVETKAREEKPAPRREARNDREDRRDRNRDKADICRNSDDELQCNIDALDDLDCDKHQAGSCTKAEAKAASLVSRIQRLAKEDLESDDEDLRSEAQDKIADASESLKSFAKSSGVNRQKVDKFADKLTAYADASMARGDVLSRDYQSRAKEIRDTLRTATSACARSKAYSDCNEKWQAEHDRDAFKQELKTEFVDQEHVRNLVSYHGNNTISTGDYREFLNPYLDVLHSLAQADDKKYLGAGSSSHPASAVLAGLGDFTAPSDLSATRSALRSNLPAGVTAPSRTFNAGGTSAPAMGQFGLSSGNTSIGPNPFQSGAANSGGFMQSNPLLSSQPYGQNSGMVNLRGPSSL